MKKINIIPFAREISENEWVWEEARDIESVVLEPQTASQQDLSAIKVLYWKKIWPEERWETSLSRGTGGFGWAKTDDWFNGEYKLASTEIKEENGRIIIGFRPFSEEYPAEKNYAVRFRRTMKLKIGLPAGSPLKNPAVYTTSPCKQAALTIESKDNNPITVVSTYNCELLNTVQSSNSPIVPAPTLHRGEVSPSTNMGGQSSNLPIFQSKIKLTIMTPKNPFSGDEPLVTLNTDKGSFTFNVKEALENPVFVPLLNILVKNSSDTRPFGQITCALKKNKTIYDMVFKHKEQSLKNALKAMPKPDLTYYFVGCKHSRQKFMIFPDGAILIRDNPRLMNVKGEDTPGIKREGNWGLKIGLQDYRLEDRYIEKNKLPILTSIFRKGTVSVSQTVFAVPLLRSILAGEIPPDSPVIAIARIIIKNTGRKAASVKLKLSALAEAVYTNNAVAGGKPEGLIKIDELVYTYYKNENLLRFSISSSSPSPLRGEGKFCESTQRELVYKTVLRAGGSEEVVIKIPFTALKTAEELSALGVKEFGRELAEAKEFWEKQENRGCGIRTPEPILNDFHRTHLAHVFITDEAMPDDNKLVNTCVGTVSYGNFSNESCMIINDLDQRGLHDEAERRLGVFLKYQGTVPQPGNFTDYNGMFFGAGGYECGHYNQHHGWVLWCAGEHFRLSGNAQWLLSSADRLIAGCDWVIRQRNNTKKNAGAMEYGFLPAGSLEDVTEFYYWLSTNTLTWWGLDSCARALLEAGHPEGKRLGKEAGEYADDLRTGFRQASRRSPVVKLRDGTYVPHFPSRLYLRGRDYGWIREVLEGAIYTLIARLFDPCSQEAAWILKDYEDNRYVDRRFGYGLRNFKKQWFGIGGFSMQPNLLPGPLPYLYRDEIRHFLRALFNGFASAYRPDLNLLVEHPLPKLGITGGAHFKTSDEANFSRWLKMMFVCEAGDELYIGKGIPRQWFAKKEKMWLKNVKTGFGAVSAEYKSVSAQRIVCNLELNLRKSPGNIFVRIRHPKQAQIKKVLVNGSSYSNFDPAKEWVVFDKPVKDIKVEVLYY